MPFVDHATLCRTDAKMLCPVNCNLSYFIRGVQWKCYDAISRSKPGFLPNHVPGKQYGVIIARLQRKRLTTDLEGLLVQEQHIPVQPSISAFPKDQDGGGAVEFFESDSLCSKPFFDDLIVEGACFFGSEDTIFVSDEGANLTENYQPIEEPWLLLGNDPIQYAEEGLNARLDLIEGNGALKSLRNDDSDNFRRGNSSVESDKMSHLGDKGSNSSWSFPEREHPVEDPWLVYPSFGTSETHVKSASTASTICEPIGDENNPLGLQEQCHQVTETLLSGKESNLLPQKDSVSVEILINCSICTMQRIAVLEDGNLVELLLEPVKSNVQCDSVYLGVVTKLVPHMGGAFVNIGSARPSLMDIKHNRKPFIFPPFAFTSKEKSVNCSPSPVLEKHPVANKNEQAFLEEDEAALSDDDTEVDFQDDFFDDHETHEDLPAEDVELKSYPNCEVNDIGTSLNTGGSADHLSGNDNYLNAQSDNQLSHEQEHESTKNVSGAEKMWTQVCKGTKILVQVVKEGLGTKGPTLTAYPKLRSRFWVLMTQCNRIGVSKKISGVERTRLRVIAKSLQPPGFGLTVRTVAAGRTMDELQKDLEGLLSTWRNVMEHAKSAALAADEGVEGAVPVILHQAMSQTLSVVQDYFSEKVKRMVVDSPRTYHEVTNYLQDIAPDLCDRVELHKNKVPLFDEFNIEEEINNILKKRVALPNGGSLVIEQTEALVSIDVNGGHGMFGEETSQEKAVLDVNLAAAKQIARELRLRDIGGIIVVDFIDMLDDSNKRLVYEEIRTAVERDRSMVKVSELSKHGLMEITRKRVRPSVTFMISEPCSCCHATGRVEALETSFSKLEHEICRLLATMDQKADPANAKSWPRILLRVDSYMCDYLTSGKKTRLANLSSSLKVWILLKVARSFKRGAFEVKLVTDEKASNDHNQGALTMVPHTGPELPISTKRTKLFPIRKWKAARKGL